MLGLELNHVSKRGHLSCLHSVLQWRHVSDVNSNHQPFDCLCKKLFILANIKHVTVLLICYDENPIPLTYRKRPLMRVVFPYQDIIMVFRDCAPCASVATPQVPLKHSSITLVVDRPVVCWATDPHYCLALRHTDTPSFWSTCLMI